MKHAVPEVFCLCLLESNWVAEVKSVLFLWIVEVHLIAEVIPWCLWSRDWVLTLYYVVVEVTMSLIEQISFVHCCDSGTMDYSWSIGLWITINCLESDLKMPCKMPFECLLKSWYVGLLTTLSLCWLMCAVREVGHRLYCVSAKKCGANLAMNGVPVFGGTSVRLYIAERSVAREKVQFNFVCTGRNHTICRGWLYGP